LPLDVKLISSIEFDVGRDARSFEKKLLKLGTIRSKTMYKFDGYKELFTVNPIEYAREHGIESFGKQPSILDWASSDLHSENTR